MDYSYFNSQHSSVGIPPLYIKNNSMPFDNLNGSGIYQSLDIDPSYPDLSTAMDFKIPPLSSIEPELYQPGPLDINLAPRRTASSSSSVTPTESDLDSLPEFQSSVSHEIDSAMQGHKTKNVKRRQQNRDAQRRYRERRDERTKSLEQTVHDLEAKRQWLSNSFFQKSQEVNQLFRDNGLLQNEIQELRQRWQMMIMLLQRPKALQSLSTLMAEDVGLGAAVFGTPVEPARLDEFLRCLDAVLVPDAGATNYQSATN
ncbi:hypothetical protein BJX68DRAFT_98266 [Aspergillus pseudodeflectus]|uniref:BZIP domain-containing protein n=1 Tax=Aspergillus pseudodeflectus TaxID=176178 RepID=A0ABR4K9R6_9EURO